MKIIYFHRHPLNGPSITKSFVPLINKIKETEKIEEYHVPQRGASPLDILRNILFVYKHRTKEGINHITGDIHYCILGLTGCKSVLTIHDDYAMVTATKGWPDRFYKWLFWFYLPIKLAGKVVCISEATKQKTDKLVKNKKTEILTHHTFDHFSHTPKVFNKDRPAILQIGTSPQKNLETTLKALAGIHCQLRVVKKMSETQHQSAQSLKIDYSNVFDLSDEEIINEYQKADIVVFPSLFEGLGMIIPEAQAIGRVVITSNIPPMNRVAGEGAFFLNNPLDEQEYKTAVLKILNDASLRQKLIQAGLKNVRKYTIKEVAAKYMNLYNQI
ncbi:mannosyltransferase [Bacteroidia bacterium]|nr:mannosyltransferase [Bacteroidia bacterium]